MKQFKKTRIRELQKGGKGIISFCISVLLCIALLSACTNELSDVVENQEKVPEKVLVSGDFTISQDDALAELNELLPIIDAQEMANGLRSSARKRAIGNIGVVSREKNAANQNSLRAGVSEDSEPLLYIVNFENEEGYARRRLLCSRASSTYHSAYHGLHRRPNG
jgi:hypothetical protein